MGGDPRTKRRSTPRSALLHPLFLSLSSFLLSLSLSSAHPLSTLTPHIPSIYPYSSRSSLGIAPLSPSFQLRTSGGQAICPSRLSQCSRADASAVECSHRNILVKSPELRPPIDAGSTAENVAERSFGKFSVKLDCGFRSSGAFPTEQPISSADSATRVSIR